MRRIFIAFLIMMIGFGATWFFLRPSDWSSANSNQKPIARIVSLKNDVKRQPEGKLLWTTVRQGDVVYLGDKIKTEGLSSTQIQFEESKSKLEIEENTTIVMALNNKKLSLNMLEGRVFVQQQEGNDNLELLSGGEKVNVQGNTAISVKDGVRQVQEFSDGFFTELKPEYSTEIMTAKKVVLSWKAQTSEQMVEVFVGESPALLTKVPGAQASVTQGKMEVQMKPGVNYWQLVSGDKKSALMKLNLNTPIAPAPIYPAVNELVKIEERPFDFKWTRGNVSDNSRIEIAKDESFKNIVFTQDVQGQTFWTPPTPLNEGNYFWRIRNKLANDWIDSKSAPFSMVIGNNLLSPTPLSPADHAIIYSPKSQSATLKLEWRREPRAQSYTVKLVSNEGEREIPATENTITIPLPKAGPYQWQVLALNEEGKASLNPIQRNFEIRPVGKIRWLMTQKEYVYLKDLPVLILTWEKSISSTSRLFISAYADLKDAETFEVQGKDFPYRVPRAGTYFAKVQTLDSTGQIAGESDIYNFNVTEAPVPPAPQIAKKGEKIMASPQGDLILPITNSKLGWLTLVQIVDARGRTVDERRFNHERIQLNGLLPGKYQLVSKFEDEFKRAGEMSRFDFEVPAKSTAAPPKVKGVTVR